MENEERSKKISRRLSWALMALGGVLVLLLIFDAGFVLGSRHTLETRGARMSIMQNGPGPNFGIGAWGVSMPHGFAPDGHGAVGTIENISLPKVTITTRDGDDTKIILITPQTKIEGQLEVGQQIIAIGEPGTTTEGQLTAVLVRILPPPPTN